MDMSDSVVIKQHLIDPEICIRCNTCEATCPVGAITHDSRNYVVDATKCNFCMDCIPPCPTGSIDNWRQMPKVKAYSVDEQLTWDVLPVELTPEQLAEAGVSAESTPAVQTAQPSLPAASTGDVGFNSAQFNATLPPWSAAHAYTNLYGPKAAQKTVTATVTGNVRVTEVGNYIFRICFIDPFQGAVLAKFAHGSLRAKRVALLTSVNSPYSVGLSAVLREVSDLLDPDALAVTGRPFVEHLGEARRDGEGAAQQLFGRDGPVLHQQREPRLLDPRERRHGIGVVDPRQIHGRVRGGEQVVGDE